MSHVLIALPTTPLGKLISTLSLARTFASYKAQTNLPYRAIFPIYRNLGDLKFRIQLYIITSANLARLASTTRTK